MVVNTRGSSYATMTKPYFPARGSIHAVDNSSNSEKDIFFPHYSEETLEFVLHS